MTVFVDHTPPADEAGEVIDGCTLEMEGAGVILEGLGVMLEGLGSTLEGLEVICTLEVAELGAVHVVTFEVVNVVEPGLP